MISALAPYELGVAVPMAYAWAASALVAFALTGVASALVDMMSALAAVANT
jgi:hypothetical protein